MAEVHAEAAPSVREAPFLGHWIPALDCTALAGFKALFDRTRDWADVGRMLTTGSIDLPRATRWHRRLQGSEGQAAERLAGLPSSSGIGER